MKCRGTGEIAHVPGAPREPGNCGDGIPPGLVEPPARSDADRKPAPPVKAKPKPKKPKKKGGRR